MIWRFKSGITIRNSNDFKGGGGPDRQIDFFHVLDWIGTNFGMRNIENWRIHKIILRLETSISNYSIFWISMLSENLVVMFSNEFWDINLFGFLNLIFLNCRLSETVGLFDTYKFLTQPKKYIIVNSFEKTKFKNSKMLISQDWSKKITTKL